MSYTKQLFLSRSLVLQERFVNSYFAVVKRQDVSLPFINEMLENHKKCPYWSRLRHFCPSLLDRNREKTNESRKHKKIPPNKLIENASPIHSIFLFLRSIFLHVVPTHVLGDRHNLNHFLMHIKKLLSIQLHGQMSLQYLVEGIKSRHIEWLQSYDQKVKREMLNQTIHFLVTSFIGPLIQSFFIVTESTSFKNRLFFYRKVTWHRLTQCASSKFLHSCKLKLVPKEWVEAKLNEGRCLGISSIRFLVKTQSLRPIVNMSMKTRKKASVNQHLKTLLLVLTFEKVNSPALFGSTIMKIDDIHSKWKEFVSRIRNLNVCNLYFVKVDIEKCFDTINPCLLYSIVSKILRKDYYKVYKYRKRIMRGNDSKIIYFESLQNSHTLSNTEMQNVEHCGSYEVSRQILVNKLCALLFCNVIKLGKKHYVQTVGISQGSALSSILCGAYYGYMEQTIQNEVIGKNDLLIRMVDDMLYVTPSKSNAQGFLRMMLEGVPEFNCRCNLRKCSINFNYSHPVFGNVPQPPSSLIKYCGLAFDTETFNVYADFSNYRDVQTKDTVSWDLTLHPGVRLRNMMLMSVRPKCASVLFDTDINSTDTIQYNLMCIFALCAVKFHCLVMHLPPKRRIQNNPAFFVKIIRKLPMTLISYVTRCFRRLGQNGPEFKFPLSTATVASLCNQTFLFKLTKHHQMYIPLIKRLQENEKSKVEKGILKKQISQAFINIYLR